jgi:hypothetical protein
VTGWIGSIDMIPRRVSDHIIGGGVDKRGLEIPPGVLAIADEVIE